MDKASILVRHPYVQKAQLEDIDMIVELDKIAFYNPWSRESIKSFYYKKNADVFIWKEKNRISGYIMAEHVIDQGEIHRIAIIPGLRGSGLAKEFHDIFLKHYRYIGVNMIFLEVRESNVQAIKFYEKCGYERQGRRAKYYKSPMEDAILMYCDAEDTDHSLPVDSKDVSSYNTHEEETTMMCNVCGNSINEKQDYIDIKKEWGYFSEKDTEIHSFKICEQCYDRLISQFEIKPKITEKKELL